MKLQRNLMMPQTKLEKKANKAINDAAKEAAKGLGL